MRILLLLKQHLIVHADIKMGNVFVSAKEGGKVGAVRLGDFELAARLASSDASLGPDQAPTRGTVGYHPPECFDATPSRSFPGDVFAAGAVLYYWLIGEELEAPPTPEVLKELYTKMKSEYSGLDLSVCRRMLSRAPARRPDPAAEAYRIHDNNIDTGSQIMELALNYMDKAPRRAPLYGNVLTAPFTARVLRA
jgi:hypothetical protein